MCLGVPGRVIDIRTDEGGVMMGRVDFDGVKREVCLDLVPECEVGDYVMVHVGFAISRLDEEEAEETLEILKQMGEIEGELTSSE